MIMYDILIRSEEFPTYVCIGTTYLDDIDKMLNFVKSYIEKFPLDNIYKTTFKQKYKDTKYIDIKITDCYNDNEEFYSTRYDIENDKFIKEV